MKGIVVFDDTGIPRASIGFEQLEMKPELFSSVMSAIQMYAKQSVGQEISGIKYGKLRLLIGSVEERYIVTFHAVSDEEAEWNHNAALKIIKKEDFMINDLTLEILRDLLADEPISFDDIRGEVHVITTKDKN
ncbi:MAG: hypothetical protein GF411_09395 [Candidatus Lokiarchaeota archaeon]|nr:hypothetical protein [Candidatus Lokiarchaeota archaeon]